MGQLSFIIKSVTNLHINQKIAMQKICLSSICKLIEFLKIMKIIFSENFEYFVDTIHCIAQHMQHQALFVIDSTKKKLLTDAAVASSSSSSSPASAIASNERNVDIITALKLAEKCLYGPATIKRILLTRLSLSIADPNRIFAIDHLQKLSKILTRIEIIINLQKNISNLCNSTFMHWPETMLPIYVKQYMEIGMDIDKIMVYMFFYIYMFAII